MLADGDNLEGSPEHPQRDRQTLLNLTRQCGVAYAVEKATAVTCSIAARYQIGSP
jgi:hypothetical protein